MGGGRGEVRGGGGGGGRAETGKRKEGRAKITTPTPAINANDICTATWQVHLKLIHQYIIVRP